MNKITVSLILVVVIAVGGLIGYAVTHETIDAGYVGYVYDRTASPTDDNVIEGTSVINVERTGRIRINPMTQDVLVFPTTIVSYNWTGLAEEDSRKDMSMQIASQEGKNIDADIYISVRPTDIGKIIKSFGTKSFDAIVNNDIYGLTKGKLSSISQAYSVYDIQSSRVEIQSEAFEVLSKTLDEIYGVELVRLEIGTLILPTDIQEKIDQKTQAQNEVELAKLDREKQNEINQKIVDEQEANSKVELIKRQNEADAAAYEKQKAAEAELSVSEANIKIAEQELQIAKLNKEAELEKQKAYTDEYFRDRELDVQTAAVKAINGSVKTIITSGDDNAYAGLVGISKILDEVTSK